MRKLHLIAIVLASFTLASCSQTGSEATLKISGAFTFGGAATSAYSGGGLMVWGKDTSGNGFGKVLDSSDSITLSLKGGTWTFYAMSWMGEDGTTDLNGNGTTSDTMIGAIRCAKATTELSGSSMQVGLDLANEHCSLNDFLGKYASVGSVTAGSKNIGSLQLELCDNIAGVNSSTDKCTDNPFDANRKAARGHAMSYRLALKSYDKVSGAVKVGGTSLYSACMSGVPTTDFATGTPGTKLSQVPAGDGVDAPFYTEIELFPGDETCSLGPHGVRKAVLPNGLSNAAPTTAKYFLDTSLAQHQHKLYLKMGGAEICTGTALSANFAGGDGSQGAPLLVCNVPQFHNMVPVAHGQASASASVSFKLLADIDLNPYSKGANYPSGWTPPAWYNQNCMKLGSNFIPLGHDPANCTTGANPATVFGDFDGGGKTITGIRNNFDTLNFAGLIASFRDGTIRNLRIRNAEFAGKSQVGTLVGTTPAPTVVTVHNVVLENPRLEAREDSGAGGQYAGGVVGYGQNVDMKHVFVTNARVRSDGTHAGGFFGQLSRGTIQSSSVTGEVSSTYSAGYVGGLAGQAGNNSGTLTTFLKVKFEGFVDGTQYVGGLIGWADDLALTSSYAHALVNSRHPSTSAYAGGLIGKVGSAATVGVHRITDSFFYGRIRYKCPIGNTCDIGDLVGYSPVLVPSPHLGYYITRTTPLTTSLYGTQLSASDFLTSQTTPIGLSSAFVNLDNDIPRLDFEATTHPCRSNNAHISVTSQIFGLGKGTAANPIQICNGAQFASIQTYPGYHFRFANYVLPHGDIADRWAATFSGSIDGKDFGLLGLTVAAAASNTHVSWWDQISSTGVIKNLNLYGSLAVGNSVGSSSVSAIARHNDGTLQNIRLKALTWDAKTAGGGVVNTNTGLIKGLSLDGEFSVLTQAAAVAYQNQSSGKIVEAKVDANLGCKISGDCTSNSGFVHTNDGLISKAEVRSRVYDMNESYSIADHALVTLSNSGTGIIEDVHLDRAEIHTRGMMSHAVARTNAGIVRRILSQAQLYTTVATLPTLVPGSQNDWEHRSSPSVGFNNGGTISYLVYGEKSYWSMDPGSLIDSGTDTLSGCTVVFNSNPSWFGSITGSNYADFGVLGGGEFSPLEAVPGGSPVLYFFDTGADDCSTLGDGTVANLTYRPMPQNGTQITDFTDFTNFSSWSNTLNASSVPIWIAEMNDPAQVSQVVDFYLAYLNGQPLPALVPTWEFDPNDGMRIFTLHDD